MASRDKQRKSQRVKEREMENKTQEDASTIKVSSLTCIDLDNSDLHHLAVFLKQVCLHLIFLNDYSVIIITSVKNTDSIVKGDSCSRHV